MRAAREVVHRRSVRRRLLCLLPGCHRCRRAVGLRRRVQLAGLLALPLVPLVAAGPVVVFSDGLELFLELSQGLKRAHFKGEGTNTVGAAKQRAHAKKPDPPLEV